MILGIIILLIKVNVSLEHAYFYEKGGLIDHTRFIYHRS